MSETVVVLKTQKKEAEGYDLQIAGINRNRHGQ